MTLHTEWMRFKRETCRGKTMAEIANIKWVFYCGVLTTVNLVLDMQKKNQVVVSGAGLRAWEAVLKDCAAFQKSLSAPKAKKGKQP